MTTPGISSTTVMLGRSRLASPCRAFTLVELLVAITLIAGLMAFFIGNLSGGGKSASLQSAQSVVANMITAARTRAMAGGQTVRVLVHVDPNSVLRPARFLRYVVIQAQVSGAWVPVADAFLPDGVYVLPGNFASIPGGLFPADAAATWVKSDGSPLRSTVLRNAYITLETINSPTAEQWVNFSLAPAGTTGQTGNIILAAGKVRPPGSVLAGESPVELESAEIVRGLSLSQYGVPTLVNSRASF